MTLPIDLQFKHVGRLHLRSGTHKRATRDAMKEMLRTLNAIGRQDVLEALRDGKVTVMEVFRRYRAGRLSEMPTGELLRPFGVAYRAWLDDKELSPKTRTDYRKAVVRVEQYGKAGARLTDLPAMLAAHRTASRTVRPRTFVKDRAAVLSFLGTLLGERHWLYAECARVAPLKIPEVSKMDTNPQTLAEIRALAGLLPPHHVFTLWGYYLTGMRPEEMFEEDENRWTTEPALVRIDGTKTPASKRTVPLVDPLLIRPRTKRRAFAKALAKASRSTVTPYDLRRSYSQLLDLARIPTFRQDYYMAHGPTNLNALYKRAKECLPYLQADAEAIRQVLRDAVPEAVR